MSKVIIVLFLVAMIGSGVYYYVQTRHEQPRYQALESHKNIQIRQYDSMIVAQNTQEVSQEKWDSINDSFKILAAYIFGKNERNEKIGMTVPVLMQKESDKRTMMFYMPSRYKMDKLPKTEDERITFAELPRQKIITIQFSGRSSDENYNTHLKELEDFIKEKGIKTRGNPIYAVYNNPWTTPPFMRRNEIWMVIE